MEVEVDGKGGATVTVPFDYLLVGAGSSYAGPIKPGADELTIASRLASVRAYHARLKTAGSILIIGAGPVGVELAGEIITEFPAKTVVVTDMSPAVCSALPAASSRHIETWLRAKGCELVLGTAIGGSFPDLLIDDAGCTLSDGRRLDADLVVRCMG